MTGRVRNEINGCIHQVMYQVRISSPSKYLFQKKNNVRIFQCDLINHFGYMQANVTSFEGQVGGSFAFHLCACVCVCVC